MRTERALLREGLQLLAGMDEVGRGALGGPVTVGVVLVDLSTATAPKGLRDSKLLTPAAREALAPRLRRWGRGWSVGHASAAEIDEYGILRALRLAGRRALAGLAIEPDAVLLDGNYDYLCRPAPVEEATGVDTGGPVRVETMIKADLRCASVAAASVLAKTTRDAMMVGLADEHPGYGWAENKGYSSRGHFAALRLQGACQEHRRSWNLRALAEAPEADLAVADDVAAADAAADDAGLLDPDARDPELRGVDGHDADLLDVDCRDPDHPDVDGWPMTDPGQRAIHGRRRRPAHGLGFEEGLPGSSGVPSQSGDWGGQ